MVLDNDATQAKIDRLQVLEKSISDKRRKIREAMGCLELTIPDTIKRDGSPDIIKNKYNTQTGTDLTDTEREEIHAIWSPKSDALLA